MKKTKNPYSGVRFRQPLVASEMQLPVAGGSKESLVGRDGHINAGSRKEAAQIVAALMEVARDREVVTAETAETREKMVQVHREALLAAFDSREHLVELGEVMADELYVAGNRDGFARRFMAYQQLSQGQIPSCRMRMKDVVAITASSPSKVETSLVRDNYYYPPEFYISARPFVEKRDIDRSNTDVLEEKFVEATEGIMVSEDRVWRKMALATVGMANEQTTIIGTMTPLVLGQMRNKVTRWNIPASNWLIANDIWSDIIGDPDFMEAIDQITKHELILTGKLGSILGMDITSDAFRHPQHKVLEQGEMFIVGDPVNHGQYTDRGGIESQPIDGTHESIPGRGWFFTESMSMIITNARSVHRAIRR